MFRRNAVYVLIILSLLTGLFTGRAFFFSLTYVLLALLIVSFLWSWLSIRWISIGRRTRARRAQVGHYLEESFAIRNRSILPKLWIEVADHSNLPGHQVSYVVPAVGIRRTHRWDVRSLCLARGEFRLGPMSLASGDPFGLFYTQRNLGTSSQIIVYPHTVNLPHFEMPAGVLSGGEAQRRRSHYVTTNASGVRDYVPGDSFNRIHWPSTARKGRLVVKEFEIDPLVDVWLFPDFSRESFVEAPSIHRVYGTAVMDSPGTLPPASDEYIATIGASLAQYFIHRDRALGFLAYSPSRQVYQPDRGSRQLTRIMESLAVAKSTSSYTLGQMLALEAPYFARGTTLIMVTASLSKSWVTELQILNRRGLRTMCILLDPTSFETAEDQTNDVGQIQGLLSLSRIPVIVVKRGDDLSYVLSRRGV